MKTNIIRKLLHLQGIQKKWSVFLVNHVYAGVNPKYFPVKARLLNRIGCSIGEGTKIVGPIFFYQPFAVGKGCWIGKNMIINGDGKVIIGDNCDIAPEVTFLTGGHRIGGHDRRAGEGQTYQIKVGEGCWIGAGSTIVGPAEIGDGSVVAACACVVNDVKEDSLVGGVPARLIKKLE